MSKRKSINEAARWTVRLQADESDTRVHQQFETWLRESPENSDEYDKLSFLDQAGFLCIVYEFIQNTPETPNSSANHAPFEGKGMH